jgi:hypothetical protein
MRELYHQRNGLFVPTLGMTSAKYSEAQMRRVAVYVPKQYVPGTEAPFIVGADGPDQGLFTALDNDPVTFDNTQPQHISLRLCVRSLQPAGSCL